MLKKLAVHHRREEVDAIYRESVYATIANSKSHTLTKSMLEETKSG